MAHRVITVNSAADWKNAAREILNYANRLSAKLDTACQEVANEGKKEADACYAANTGYDNDDVATLVIKNAVCDYNLSAEGPDLYFNEFGAGVMTDTSHPYAKSASVEIRPGSWSEKEGTGEFAQKNYWHYQGEVFTFKPPSRAMYHAHKRMESAVPNVLRRVFK